jgi:predicted O-methyltransferase YrrM
VFSARKLFGVELRAAFVSISLSEWIRLLEACEKLSKRLGVPHIGWDDGAALYALAFAVASGKKEFTAVDAGAGVGFSALWVLAALESAGVSGRLIAIEALKERFEKLVETLSKAPVELAKAEAARGDAVELIASLERVDFAFVDIEKLRYVEAFDALSGKLSVGGIAAFHNAFIAESQVSRIMEKARSMGWAVTVIPTGEGLLVVKRS